ncbi:hypothetical protein BEWA_032140 [Theileria equi strain WA]|uniref:C3H1-type domain-containing protein n=1 Tax=Theileria equi strain WA TaxID=1537102 RepID=L0AZC2_THEEQ|nr:hypothetical protein BEWA_032140 [Theileria equi strain WA]AFZ80361.1 hypothetical protein BEWA_032140 [Theileria equi strain WA]|eukprot:XP_004830027.1 hypothetical protein BEWA_032140 [Theileria equi strain WA]
MYRGRGSYNRGHGFFDSSSGQNDGVWYAPDMDDDQGYRNHGHMGYSSGYGNRHGHSNKPTNLTVCRHHALLDKCRYGAKCAYSHLFKRVMNMMDIFRGGICSCTVKRASDQSLDLFACGYGPSIKRWKLYGDAGGNIKLSSGSNLVIPMPENYDSSANRFGGRGGPGYNSGPVIHSLVCIEDFLFSGLKTGHICVHHLPSGNSTMLDGHKHPVKSITVIDGIVLSVCESGKINLWTFDNSTGAFNCVNSLLTETRVNCLLEVKQDAARTLWAGGSTINIIELGSLSIAKTIQLPHGAIVRCFKLYGNHVIAGFTDGSVRIYNHLGDEVFATEGQRAAITALEGMEAAGGDSLLIGYKSGLLMAVQLPSFNLLGELSCHFEGPKNSSKGGISSVISLGPKHFMTSGYDGNISIFTWDT